eukprot:CAMPEP_0117022642 /NCGR_PEP_ID=MMETSP0472-20121206/16991_1 /TAXON_ID=693140 ORGANISM="Tiarina fusus, Strain LIS" /NCGR_SAMPLE_ID=MMETSP0472 /ASSEMBLY_ACC=CAM_ASM_000603 /LENGTH=437 /DNA_ID=CAMNT_0004728553 /DNA_START=124 /DNA_END=1440 /DNA_ORIENTATION=-
MPATTRPGEDTIKVSTTTTVGENISQFGRRDGDDASVPPAEYTAGTDAGGGPSTSDSPSSFLKKKTQTPEQDEEEDATSVTTEGDHDEDEVLETATEATTTTTQEEEARDTDGANATREDVANEDPKNNVLLSKTNPSEGIEDKKEPDDDKEDEEDDRRTTNGKENEVDSEKPSGVPTENDDGAANGAPGGEREEEQPEDETTAPPVAGGTSPRGLIVRPPPDLVRPAVEASTEQEDRGPTTIPNPEEQPDRSSEATASSSGAAGTTTTDDASIVDKAIVFLDNVGIVHRKRNDLPNGRTVFSFGTQLSTCNLDNRLDVRETSKVVAFYSISPLRIPETKRQVAMEFFTRANYDLLHGCFEFDLRDGEFRYKVSSCFVGVTGLTDETIRYMYLVGTQTVSRYFEALMQVLYSGKSPVAAIQDCEVGAGSTPAASPQQ